MSLQPCSPALRSHRVPKHHHAGATNCRNCGTHDRSQREWGTSVQSDGIHALTITERCNPEAISENATQVRDLSPREVQQVESIANEYDEPTGGFFIRKNGTKVRISLGYEV